MATTRVQLPDGNIGEFPAEMGQDQIQAVLAKQFPAQAPPDPSGRTPTGEVAPDDTRNAFQRMMDNLTRPDTRRQEWQSPARNTVDKFAQGAAGNLSPLAHPLETVEGIGHTIAHPIDTAKGMWAEAKENPIGTAGSLAGGAALGELGGSATGAASRALAGPMERGGLNLGNAALGARGPKPFKYGANPARGAFEEGVLPAVSKHSASMKLAAALPEVGQRISDKVMAGGTAPLDDIARSIESPINEARGIIEGPGGGNRSIEPLEALRSSMERRAPGASRPIYGPNAGTPYTAEEAATAITRPGQRLLAAPTEEIPLHAAPGPRNPRMRPMAFDAKVNPEEPWEPRSGDNFAPISEYPGVNPHYLSGSEHPELSGRVTPLQNPQQVTTRMGVLRRPMEFPASEQPSPLSNLTHPHATAPDVWRTIQNVDKNTRFNPDPEVEGVNELRRDIRGGLRGNLEEAVPGLKPETQRYSDLKSAEETLDRTLHGGTSLRKMLNVPMFPVETTVGRAMYGAGKAMAKPSVFSNAGPAFGLVQSLRDKKKEQ